MRHDEGGGASKSTDPAAGSSAATDVSLREFVMLALQAERQVRMSERAADQKAVDTAFLASQELAQKHNDLIRLQERKEATYATKDDLNRLSKWQAQMTGGLIAVGAIGIANIVKIWAG